MSIVLLPLANQVQRQFADFPDVDMRFDSAAAYKAAVELARIPDGWLAYCKLEKAWYQANKENKEVSPLGKDSGSTKSTFEFPSVNSDTIILPEAHQEGDTYALYVAGMRQLSSAMSRVQDGSTEHTTFTLSEQVNTYVIIDKFSNSKVVVPPVDPGPVVIERSTVIPLDYVIPLNAIMR